MNNWKCYVNNESVTIKSEVNPTGLKYAQCGDRYETESELLDHYGKDHSASELADWFAERFGEVAPSHREHIMDRYSGRILTSWAMESGYDEDSSDGMGNGAQLYRLDDGTLWVLEWNDAGFDTTYTLASEDDWSEIAERYYVPEDEAYDL